MKHLKSRHLQFCQADTYSKIIPNYSLYIWMYKSTQKSLILTGFMQIYSRFEVRISWNIQNSRHLGFRQADTNLKFIQINCWYILIYKSTQISLILTGFMQIYSRFKARISLNIQNGRHLEFRQPDNNS